MSSKIDQRTDLVWRARLAEKLERYDEMVLYMSEVALMHMEFSKKERELLWCAFYKHMQLRRSSWETLTNLAEKEATNAEVGTADSIVIYKVEIAQEIQKICTEFINLLDEHILPFTENRTSIIFFLRLKGDQCRYMAESIQGEEFAFTKQNAYRYYEEAMRMADKFMLGCNPIRLGVYLNASTFLCEICFFRKLGTSLAKKAVKDAVGIDCLDKEDRDRAAFIIKLLRHNITEWKHEEKNEQEGRDTDSSQVSQQDSSSSFTMEDNFELPKKYSKCSIDDLLSSNVSSKTYVTDIKSLPFNCPLLVPLVIPKGNESRKHSSLESVVISESKVATKTLFLETGELDQNDLSITTSTYSKSNLTYYNDFSSKVVSSKKCASSENEVFIKDASSQTYIKKKCNKCASFSTRDPDGSESSTRTCLINKPKKSAHSSATEQCESDTCSLETSTKFYVANANGSSRKIRSPITSKTCQSGTTVKNVACQTKWSRSSSYYNLVSDHDVRSRSNSTKKRAGVSRCNSDTDLPHCMCENCVLF